MDKKNKWSYLDSRKMTKEALIRAASISGLVEDGLMASEKEAIEAVNELLIEKAEQTGLSLYDICFRMVPVIRPHAKVSIDSTRFQDNFEIEQEICLEPIEFTFSPDVDPWRKKCLELQAEVVKLRDSLTKILNEGIGS